MIGKPIEQISQSDIQSLVSAKVSERRTLDYKQQLPDKSSDASREFLYDVSSFGNASGGDMIFGIVDERDSNGKPTGLPASADGLILANVSDAIARLENLVRDGIDPRVQGIQWQQVDGFSKGLVLVLRIPKSLSGPHMVTYGGASRFYSRNSTGKYPLDVGEIRSAFIESTSIGERLREFTALRIDHIMTGASPLGLLDSPMIVLHVLPISSLANLSRDVTKGAAHDETLLKPIRSGGWGGRYNFDGYLVKSAHSKSYVQVFRSGSIEAADAALLGGMPEEYKNMLPSIALERSIIEALRRYLDAEKRLATALPIFVAITLLRVKGFKMSSSFLSPFGGGEGIDRDILPLPEVVFEDYGTNVGTALQPSFDALWQSCGIEKSFNYDDAGNWRPHAQ